MKKREVFEFSAEQNEKGVFVCSNEAGELVQESNNTIEDFSVEFNNSSIFKNKYYNDVNDIFNKSYLSNYSLKSNRLLKDAQDQLNKMQQAILDNMKNF